MDRDQRQRLVFGQARIEFLEQVNVITRLGQDFFDQGGNLQVNR